MKTLAIPLLRLEVVENNGTEPGEPHETCFERYNCSRYRLSIFYTFVLVLCIGYGPTVIITLFYILERFLLLR